MEVINTQRAWHQHFPKTLVVACSLCGDHRRRLPTSSPAAIRDVQERDAEQIRRDGLGDGVRLEIYRSEVTGDGLVRFVQLQT